MMLTYIYTCSACYALFRIYYYPAFSSFKYRKISTRAAACTYTAITSYAVFVCSDQITHKITSDYYISKKCIDIFIIPQSIVIDNIFLKNHDG